ncbi:thioredoxin family protein [Crocinitomix sp.]|nr:thioredoxin family protein [Crocinitomix sp.]
MNDYIDTIKRLLEENKTTNDQNSEAMLNYTKLSLKRLERWMAKGELTQETMDAIKNIDQKQHWTVLTEGWCGDAAHSIAFIWKMSEINPNITFQWKLRDENLDLMDQYLTNGGRSIPKLIVRDLDGNDLFDWGPRPAHIQQVRTEMMASSVPYEEMNIELQKLYNKDKGTTVQSEIIEKINAIQ